jgi:hypothetical protein
VLSSGQWRFGRRAGFERLFFTRAEELPQSFVERAQQFVTEAFRCRVELHRRGSACSFDAYLGCSLSAQDRGGGVQVRREQAGPSAGFDFGRLFRGQLGAIHPHIRVGRAGGERAAKSPEKRKKKQQAPHRRTASGGAPLAQRMEPIAQLPD